MVVVGGGGGGRRRGGGRRAEGDRISSRFADDEKKAEIEANR